MTKRVDEAVKLKTILFIIGTRPECIKIYPVYQNLKRSNNFRVLLCVTSQQRELLFQTLKVLNLQPDFDLDIMTPNQSLEEISANVLHKLRPIFEECSPDLVLVHGDTTTSFVASLAAFYHKIMVGHIEAGLRTDNIYSPWPEEMNRRLTSKIASLHFAPSERAVKNLTNEGIDKSSIILTGNTVVDTLLDVKQMVSKNLSVANAARNILTKIT